VHYFKHVIIVLNLHFYHAHEDHTTLKKLLTLDSFKKMRVVQSG